VDLFLQEWLGRYLTGVTAAVVLVSHEQEFVERSCNHIAEVISCTSRILY
jgi:ATPase subunit of ABC transporter with duplicated ATPase domains